MWGLGEGWAMAVGLISGDILHGGALFNVVRYMGGWVRGGVPAAEADCAGPRGQREQGLQADDEDSLPSRCLTSPP